MKFKKDGVVVRRLQQQRQSSLDTEENVAAETDCVFRHFVHEMYLEETSRQACDDLAPSREIMKLNKHAPSEMWVVHQICRPSDSFI